MFWFFYKDYKIIYILLIIENTTEMSQLRIFFTQLTVHRSIVDFAQKGQKWFRHS